MMKVNVASAVTFIKECGDHPTLLHALIYLFCSADARFGVDEEGDLVTTLEYIPVIEDDQYWWPEVISTQPILDFPEFKPGCLVLIAPSYRKGIFARISRLFLRLVIVDEVQAFQNVPRSSYPAGFKGFRNSTHRTSETLAAIEEASKIMWDIALREIISQRHESERDFLNTWTAQ